MGLAGIMAIIFGGIWLPQQKLTIWGIPLFVFGLSAIFAGLRPYRKLCEKETCPDELTIISNQMLEFSSNNKKRFSIPLQSISNLFYTRTLSQFTWLEKADNNGIGLILKKPIPSKIHIWDQSFNMISFQKISQKEHNCDLFFPGFSQRSAKELLDEWIELQENS